ncbi:MAG: matrixin family metalloprotease [Minicystis sp.]
MSRSRLAFTAAVGVLSLTSLTLSADAVAYCRTTSCGDKGTGDKCNPVGASDCGTPLFWTGPCVGFSVQKDGSKDVTFAKTEAVLTAAFATWMSAPCAGGGTPHVKVIELAPAVCTAHEYNQTKANTNLVVFRDDSWPYAGSAATLALTTVTYNLDTGEIYDADMELNSFEHHFTTDDATIEFDLQAVVAHEAGHFLGLAHSANGDATMYADYKQGDKSLRDLTADDIAGMCAVYPPGAAIPASCDATPRHGFSVECAAQQPEGTSSSSSSGGSSGGCAISASDDAQPGVGLAALLGALGLALRLRVRRPRR